MKKLLIYTFLLLSVLVKAQEKDKNIIEGNESFSQKKYVDAEADYRISQSKFKKKGISSYNLANSIYRQKQTAEAKYQYAKAINNCKSKAEKHLAFHNMGNCLMAEKNYEAAVNAYENALRNDPSDEETRYNYALAKLHLKNQPPKGNGKDKDKKNQDEKEKNQKNKDQNDKNKDKDKDKDKGDQKDQNKKDGKGNPDQQNKPKEGTPQQKPTGASKQRIESLLDAVNNEEKKVQEKVKLQKAYAQPVKTDKDW